MAAITTTTMISIAIACLLIDAAAATAAAAPPPQLDHCFSYLSNAGDCFTFIMNGSELRKPARECCPELANLIGTHPVCLCQLLSNSSQFGFSIDASNAVKLPSLCNISIPNTFCAGVPSLAIPNPSPAKAPGNKDNASPTIGVVPYNQHFIIGLLLILYISIY